MMPAAMCAQGWAEQLPEDDALLLALQVVVTRMHPVIQPLASQTDTQHAPSNADLTILQLGPTQADLHHLVHNLAASGLC